MTDREYNLVDEPWIRVLARDGHVEKMGLKETMLKAHEYLDIGGEMRLQDVAVLRLLTAISITLLYRYDENGSRADLESAHEAKDRFKNVWEAGRFSEKAIEEYFAKWHDRFYLFGGDHPFYQVAERQVEWREEKDGVLKPYLSNGAYMNWLPMETVNGLVQSSANKPFTPFKTLTGENAKTAAYDEAARWLLFYNAFADCSVGKNQSLKVEENGKVKKIRLDTNAMMTLPSRGAVLIPVGRNLFQTLMLSSVLYADGKRLYETYAPVWEEDEPGTDKETKPMPDDLARAYTQQARRIIIRKESGRVTGFYASAGESYTDDSLMNEPSFMIIKGKDSKTKEERFFPKHLGPGVDIWEEISHVTGKAASRDDTTGEKTGVSLWVNDLLSGKNSIKDLLPEDACIRFRLTDISYGSMNCGIQSMKEDSIVINRVFLTETEAEQDAEQEIDNIKKITGILHVFGQNCSLCMGRSEKDMNIANELKRNYHSEIGQRVREYLAGVITLQNLKEEEFRIAKNTASRFVENNTAALLSGKRKTDSHGGMTLGAAERIFYGTLRKMQKGK